MDQDTLPAGDLSWQSDFGLVAATPAPSVEMMRRELNQALDHALQRLPEDYRHVIHLRYREEHSFEAIAALMERSQNAVRKLWARAIERLQFELGAP